MADGSAKGAGVVLDGVDGGKNKATATGVELLEQVTLVGLVNLLTEFIHGLQVPLLFHASMDLDQDLLQFGTGAKLLDSSAHDRMQLGTKHSVQHLLEELLDEGLLLCSLVGLGLGSLRLNCLSLGLGLGALGALGLVVSFYHG